MIDGEAAVNCQSMKKTSETLKAKQEKVRTPQLIL
jgi:hypothetical protein